VGWTRPLREVEREKVTCKSGREGEEEQRLKASGEDEKPGRLR